jgi:hypothetical protein
MEGAAEVRFDCAVQLVARTPRLVDGRCENGVLSILGPRVLVAVVNIAEGWLWVFALQLVVGI